MILIYITINVILFLSRIEFIFPNKLSANLSTIFLNEFRKKKYEKISKNFLIYLYFTTQNSYSK